MPAHCQSCGHLEQNCTCKPGADTINQHSHNHEGIKRATYGRED